MNVEIAMFERVAQIRYEKTIKNVHALVVTPATEDDTEHYYVALTLSNGWQCEVTVPLMTLRELANGTLNCEIDLPKSIYNRYWFNSGATGLTTVKRHTAPDGTITISFMCANEPLAEIVFSSILDYQKVVDAGMSSAAVAKDYFYMRKPMPLY